MDNMTALVSCFARAYHYRNSNLPVFAALCFGNRDKHRHRKSPAALFVRSGLFKHVLSLALPFFQSAYSRLSRSVARAHSCHAVVHYFANRCGGIYQFSLPLYYHSISEIGVGFGLTSTLCTRPLLTLTTLSAIGVMALLCVMIITVVPDFLAWS